MGSEVTIASQMINKVRQEAARVIVGQQEMIDGVVIGLLTGGHVLLEGVPGLAKTLTIATIARTVALQFHRVQFTPDLLPTDLIGTMVFNPKTGDFYPKKGPIFANLVLADEINRAPAKVQSALLEAMAERQVTIGEVTYQLERPFLVMATQNPIEQEGTYPLPEAQMDRFMFKIHIDYPSRADELEIINRMATLSHPEPHVVLNKEDLLRCTEIVDTIYVDHKIKNYIVDLVMATRRPQEYGLAQLSPLIQLGCSPRASLALVRAAKGHAFLQGRDFVTIEDVKAMAYMVLRHRLILSFEAEAENLKVDDILRKILSHVESG
ncbi:MAG: MoxR family ATPase [Bdellovibrionaceae bacterium]|nr:MoxR family ATPase [Pseudobdellovibrionaceae bacterium]MDW8189614.1 MoxR family ATPase [Pseudobdellovibrionaceae bacterium]